MCVLGGGGGCCCVVGAGGCAGGEEFPGILYRWALLFVGRPRSWHSPPTPKFPFRIKMKVWGGKPERENHSKFRVQHVLIREHTVSYFLWCVTLRMILFFSSTYTTIKRFGAVKLKKKMFLKEMCVFFFIKSTIKKICEKLQFKITSIVNLTILFYLFFKCNFFLMMEKLNFQQPLL